MDRRHLIRLAGLAAGGTLLSACNESSAAIHAGHGPHPGGGTGDPSTPPVPFTVPLPVPPVLRPSAVVGGTDVYDLSVRSTTTEILPGVRTPVLGYNGRFVGPTIRARRGRPAIVRLNNGLHHPTNVHLHGASVAAASDGHPMDVVEPGRLRTYHYPNRQHGATLWYHDHSHHMEAEHVYRGLHGFYLIDDDAERRFGLPTGRYDIPIMLRDARIAADGTLAFDPADPFVQQTTLANGKPQPVLRVAARRYRLRLLNGAIQRNFQLSLTGADMIQVATDGGLLPAPVPRTELALSPGERAEIVVDFRRSPVGSRLVLADTTGPVLAFDVVGAAADNSRLPAKLRPLPPLPRATTVRDVTLSRRPGQATFTINGEVFDAARVDARIPIGTTEIWRVTNVDVDFPIDHSLHLHLVQFRVLDRDGVPPAPGEAGLKDTVAVPPGSTVRIQATFTGFKGRYVYHCHYLRHSQLGQMAQFEVV
ncbi:multicopper oxidase family protein [Micromonospora sp. WMMA1947]|uniref:multicopper oxidase family protein n=1 Tax=Micromonospora sp. WMMA1947 TaxID=3015163 RepID=UPI00248B169D|nr:multicopper oxidase family protein [Micromonospora sp. WMMA1947]WBC07610.1 multicopper oxidase family protein [Micromonospora sp. WMMA1947]